MKKSLLAFAVVMHVGISALAAPPCNPVPVKKPVEVVRREIKVAIIGANRPQGPIDEIIREFGLILWDDYYARSVRLRGGEIRPTEKKP